MKQNTVKDTVFIGGIGLHSGVDVNIKINPSKENTGIIFKRTDIVDYDNEINALYNSVIDTKLGTTIANQNGIAVHTIEHLMSALWACSIDNALIEIDNIEIPIMDGSAEIFIKEIKKIGLQEQKKNRKYLKILKEIEILKNDLSIKLSPFNGYEIELLVDFPYGGIGKQSIIFNGESDYFMHEIAKARTFCNQKEIEIMKKNGLALGGNFDNAIVFDNNKILNKTGFRCENEVVKHKLLDCIGDMFTSGYFIKGKIYGNKSGHTLNNEILKKLFSDKSNYSIIDKFLK